VEEHYPHGGLGGAVAELLGGTYPVVVDRVAVPHVYVPTGPYAEILKSYGLDAVGLEATIRELVTRHRGVSPAGLP
jgi:transketolase